MRGIQRPVERLRRSDVRAIDRHLQARGFDVTVTVGSGAVEALDSVHISRAVSERSVAERNSGAESIRSWSPILSKGVGMVMHDRSVVVEPSDLRVVNHLIEVDLLDLDDVW